MEFKPGEYLGPFKLGMEVFEVVRELDCNFKYELRHECSQLNAKTIIFNFDNNKKLSAIITKNKNDAKYNGIGYNSKIKDVVERFGDAVSICDAGILEIEGHPGVSFAFSNKDTDYLFDCGVHSEGISEDVSDVKIKSIIVTSGA